MSIYILLLWHNIFYFLNININYKVLQNMGYRNHLPCKSMDWFLYDNGPRHGRVKVIFVDLRVKLQFLETVIFPRAL